MAEERRTRLSDFGGIAADPPAGENGAGGFRMDVLTAHGVLGLPDPPTDWALLGPLVYRGNRTIIVGDTGHGKTSLALQMIGAIVGGRDMLGYKGAERGPALILDLEQGIRSIKRGLREAHLDRDDVFCVSIPDGLALDQEVVHLAELDRVLTKYRPVVVLLDPYYKAHRSEDPNAERPIIDLMRRLDGLRATYGFALILPAHPRKDVAGKSSGTRKLSLHDVAGSGAVTRGAEIVLGIERLNSGAARLRFLKDRDGELEVGDAQMLAYSKQDGFRVSGDGRINKTRDDIRADIGRDDSREWRTVTDWRQKLGVSEERAYAVLDELRKDGLVEMKIGPPGRRKDAKGYRPKASWISSLPEKSRKIEGASEDLPALSPAPSLEGAEEEDPTPGAQELHEDPDFPDLSRRFEL